MNIIFFSGFQDTLSLFSLSVLNVHDCALAVLIIAIVPCVLWLLCESLTLRLSNVNIFLNDENLASSCEILWTLIPIVMLSFLAVSSVSSLYETSLTPLFTLKVIASQWYWSWEYLSSSLDSFSSYVLSLDDLSLSSYYSLDVDNRMLIPSATSVELLVSSTDVLHAFSLPSLSIKLDAVPGRIASLLFHVDIPSILYGQCSEMCGTGHSLIPVVLEAIPCVN